MSSLSESLNQIKYRAYTKKNLEEIEELKFLPESIIDEIKLVAQILPFKTNNYVVKELINWKNIPHDPIFLLNFPQKEMVQAEFLGELQNLIKSNPSPHEMKIFTDELYEKMNPHAGGQICYNTPKVNGKLLKGIQHKYKETVLFFPSEGQMCHSFCTYCFRWSQFVGKKELKQSINDPEILVVYVKENSGIQDILFTGGDPMTMKANKLSKYIDPILESNLENLRSIRIGTKSLTYWPYRFLTDEDSDDILELFKRITEEGIHLSIMSNFNHPNELQTEALNQAVKKIQSTGAIIRTQSPILRNINDNSETWRSLTRKQVDLGMIPYYMFITRDTGAKEYFDVPLAEAFRIYTEAYRNLSGLCRTIRGPVMSTTPGKIQVVGITEINNNKVFALKFIQARNPKWVGKLFFAKYDPSASWLDELEPAFGEEFFYELNQIDYLAANSNQELESRKEEIPVSSEAISET